MRTLRALGLITLGVIAGASAVTVGSPAAAQVPSTDELNARFVVGKPEFGYTSPRYASTFRFLKDKQTGDCYLAHSDREAMFAALVKTDDNACSGF